MADYQPTSRRPIATAFRATASGVVRVCVRAGIHPDVISYLSVVASAIAAIGFWNAESVEVVIEELSVDSQIWLLHFIFVY